MKRGNLGRIGGYQLLDVLGEGGTGIVYRALQDAPLQREVALKLLKPGSESEETLRRFRREQHVLARLDHPGIARLLDAGTSESGPYLSMELVRGGDIVESCDCNRAGLRERLLLFVAICRAVQHAHQKGVLHRDLKRKNVLLEHEGAARRPKVIDFGVSRIDLAPVGTTELTLAGIPLGSMEAMSPEQAGGDPAQVDARTDVFGLGAILYELLCGAAPYAALELSKLSFEQVLRVIREVDPERPSRRAAKLLSEDPAIATRRGLTAKTLVHRLRGELDWMVMKALAKDPACRYATADAFANDIERYLAGEVVEARRSSAWYRVRKTFQRHRIAVLVSAFVGVLLWIGLGVALGAWNRARTMHARAQLASARERRLLDRLRIRDLERRFPYCWPTQGPRTAAFAPIDEWLEESSLLLGRAPHLLHAGSESFRESASPLPSLTEFDIARLRTRHVEMERRRYVLDSTWSLWERVLEDTRGRPGFEDLAFDRRSDLIPLGLDLDRTLVPGDNEQVVAPLWVFAVAGSGSLPEWVDDDGNPVAYGEPGRAVWTPEMAILLVLIPGGTFWRGAQNVDPAGPNYDVHVWDDPQPDGKRESPVDLVRVRPFLIGKYEVTTEQYHLFMSATNSPPPDYDGDASYDKPGHPIVGVQWLEAKMFSTWFGLDLPSEAEWEYACRAGTSTPFWNGAPPAEASRFVWTRAAVANGPEAVNVSPRGPYPNAFGLHNVHGNVEEWCEDHHWPTYRGAPTDGSARIGAEDSTRHRSLRGGSWLVTPEHCRSSARFRRSETFSDPTIGFRLVKRLP